VACWPVRVRGIEVASSEWLPTETHYAHSVDKIRSRYRLAVLDLAGGARRAPLVFASTEITTTVEPLGSDGRRMSRSMSPLSRRAFSVSHYLAKSKCSSESTDLARWTRCRFSGRSTELAIEFRQPFQGPRRVRVSDWAPSNSANLVDARTRRVGCCFETWVKSRTTGGHTAAGNRR